ncbi:uncharacterized protein LOC115007262 [Cottoperca gobio]|uniref:Uncharacterized protein LOC115007262 n=1 Tax=Cottoperca gobio TaxID=56716 RepID=A0A6J2PKL0_COTGO|nr:uncharacterized protein LOC115007262 [Cottoperca gobio]XP_029285909.1 uncharacterized protein LOC115007262 [Cottoperca gobio]XP_029285910.1 uncharacterized protein LOC115007262 [Cottoperca gobio]
MDPADSAPSQTAPPTPVEMIRHEQQLIFITEAMQAMSLRNERSFASLRDYITNFSTTARSSDTTAASRSPVHTSPASDAYLHLSAILVFLVCVGIPRAVFCFFELQPFAFPTEIPLLTRAKDWGTAEWEKGSPACFSVQLFTEELRKVFDHVTPGREVAPGLLDLKQGVRAVSDYSIEFCTMAAESSWNSASLLDAFYHGLSDRIKDELAAQDCPTDLDKLVALASRYLLLPLFSLSAPETKAMERYVNDSLAAGIIRPSSSPAGAGFLCGTEGQDPASVHRLQRTQ